MAVLDAANRLRARTALLRDLLRAGEVPFSKAELDAQIGNVDDFLEANATAINNAFTQPFRGQASLALKAAIVAYVALRRGGLVGRNEDA